MRQSLLASRNIEKLYGLHGGQVSWSIILIKDPHLFKIAELEIFFKQKLIIASAILNKLESFSGMVDK